MIKKNKVIAGVIALCALIGVGAGVVLANPSYFATGVSTNNSASSTPAYLTAGIATSTTPVYDSYASKAQSSQYKANQIGVLVQFTGSSTAAILNITPEYSQDGIDWYRSLITDSNALGTTTVPVSLANGVTESYNMPFASTTPNGVGVTSANSTIMYAAFLIPAPFRYVRLVLSTVKGNGAAWAQLVPIKEQY